VREEQRLGGFRFVVDRAHDAKGHVVGRRYSSGWQVQIGRGPGSDARSFTLESATGVERVRREVDRLGSEIRREREGGYTVRTDCVTARPHGCCTRARH